MSLQLIGLSVDLAGRRIVSDVDLLVPDGSFVGLLGPNGSGKSTILKAIYRVNRPAAGRLLLDGSDLLSMRARDAALRVAVVAQESTLAFDFTCLEMVMIGRTPHKGAFERDSEDDKMIVEQAIDRVGCAHLSQRGFNTLSGGEKQRVLIARALAQGADHLILDEPTNHLDIRYQIEVMEIVAGLGVTVLAALHDLSLAAMYCDTVNLLTEGRVVACGPPKTVLTAEMVRHAYGADVVVIEHPDDGTPHLIARRTPLAGRNPESTTSFAGEPAAGRDSPETNPMLPACAPRPVLQLLRKAVLLGTVLALGTTLAACGGSDATGAGPTTSSPTTTSPASSTSATAPAPSRPAYPVTVASCGERVTYDRAPARAVSNDINTTEDMLALGLESRMAGDFGVDGDGPLGAPVPAQYLAGFHQVRDVSSNYFTLEELVSLRPDFLFAGWNYGLQVGTNLTPSYLSRFGIKTLVLSESCAVVQPATASVSIDDTYQDLRNLGEIFGVETQAEQVIAGMQAQVSAVRAKIAALRPVTVFDYDSGEAAPFTGPGLAMPTALISLGGGENIFAGLKQSWTSVSWEQVVAADPQCIVINDYGTPTAAQKEKFLETNDISKTLTAVKNHCFLALSYDEVTPSPRNAEAVVAIAHWLHPEAFGLPADGS